MGRKISSKKSKKILFCVGVGFLVLFVIWTVLLKVVDVSAIGPEESAVGFATLNGFVHDSVGTNMTLYLITDWLGLVPIATAAVFAVLGLVQWIQRKSILRVDRSILALGVFYIVVIAVFIVFEIIEINYRPVLIEGVLETSYPSSTTMLVICVMFGAIIQLRSRIKNKLLKASATVLVVVFVVFMVVARILSGVHWITDIIGGAVFSTGLVLVYSVFCSDKTFDSEHNE